MEMPYTIPFTKKGKARRLPLVEAITVEHHTNQECIVKICLKKNKRRWNRENEIRNEWKPKKESIVWDSLTINLWLA